MTLADPGAMPDGAMTAVSAGVGSPDAASSDFPYDAGSKAFDTLYPAGMDNVCLRVPGEVGAANSLVPMTTAASRGIPILDAAGSPRAMPKFAQATFAIHGVPIATIALANAEVELWFPRRRAGRGRQPACATPISSKPLFTEDAGIAFWAMDGKTMRRTAAGGNHDSGARARGVPCASSARRPRARRSTPSVASSAVGCSQPAKIVPRSGGHRRRVRRRRRDRRRRNPGPALQVVNQNENLLAWFEKSRTIPGGDVARPDRVHDGGRVSRSRWPTLRT